MVLSGLATVGIESANPSAAAPSLNVLPPVSTFNDPVAVTSDGTHVWVVNQRNNSVTELDASTGAPVQVIDGPSFGFAQPDAVASDGVHVWVANAKNSVTELDAATGALVQVISPGPLPSSPADYSPTGEFDWPTALCTDGTHLWVQNNNGWTNNWSVTELDAATGALIQVIPGPSDATTGAYTGISCDHSHVWVQNGGYWVGQYPAEQRHTGTLTEFDTATGTVVQTMTETSLGVESIDGVASDGSHVWVLGGHTLVELDAATGAPIQDVTLPAGYWPSYVVADTGHVWVKYTENEMVELDATTGAFVRQIADLPYSTPNGSYLDQPKVATDGAHVWEIDTAEQSIGEIDASTGALAQVVPVNSYGFDSPNAISSDGAHVWVMAADGDSVTELDAGTRQPLRILSDPSYDFGYGSFTASADSMSSDGVHVWVADLANNAVTELDGSTGALVQVLSDPSYGFQEPTAVSSDGVHVWVANRATNSVTELDASTGALVQVLSDPSYGFDEGFSLISDGAHVWVPNLGNDSVTEIDATTGALVKVITGFFPGSLSSDGTHVWVLNGSAVVELDAATGTIVRTISLASQGIAYAPSIFSDGTDVWVASAGSSEVIDLDAGTGAVVQVISGVDEPTAIASDGTNVWVTNRFADTVTQFDSGSSAQRIYFTSAPPPNPLPGGPSYPVTAIGGRSGNPVTFSIDPSASSVCSVSGQTVSFEAPGTCTIDANEAAGNGYLAAQQIRQTFVVGPQRISFTSTPPSNGIVGGPTYTVSATGGASGNPIVLSIDPAASSVCAISGQTVRFVGPGTCVVDADQAGSAVYAPAPQAKQSFVVGAQQIVFTSWPGGPVAGGPTYTVTATGGGSGNPIVFSSSEPSVCTVSGSTVSFVNSGWCDIEANQAGNSDYLAAHTASQSFVVGAAPFAIATSAVGDPDIGVPFSLQLLETSGTPPFHWRLARGSRLPIGLHLNAKTGMLSGTPKPVDALGTYTITVLLSDSTRSVVQQTLSIEISQLPPTIKSISRSTGSSSGGTTLVIHGKNLEHASSVLFGTTPGTIEGINGSGTAMTVLVPPGSPGPVAVAVGTPAGTATSPVQFAYT